MPPPRPGLLAIGPPGGGATLAAAWQGGECTYRSAQGSAERAAGRAFGSTARALGVAYGRSPRSAQKYALTPTAVSTISSVGVTAKGRHEGLLRHRLLREAHGFEGVRRGQERLNAVAQAEIVDAGREAVLEPSPERGERRSAPVAAATNGSTATVARPRTGVRRPLCLRRLSSLGKSCRANPGHRIGTHDFARCAPDPDHGKIRQWTHLLVSEELQRPERGFPGLELTEDCTVCIPHQQVMSHAKCIPGNVNWDTPPGRRGVRCLGSSRRPPSRPPRADPRSDS
jgi:hypothetical protein